MLIQVNKWCDLTLTPASRRGSYEVLTSISGLWWRRVPHATPGIQYTAPQSLSSVIIGKTKPHYKYYSSWTMIKCKNYKCISIKLLNLIKKWGLSCEKSYSTWGHQSLKLTNSIPFIFLNFQIQDDYKEGY